MVPIVAVDDGVAVVGIVGIVDMVDVYVVAVVMGNTL